MASTLLAATVAAGLVLPMAESQQPASAAGTGTVTGHVTCGDTGRPARFAGVMLLGVPPATAAPTPEPSGTVDMAKMQAAIKSTMGTMNLVQTQTGLEGGFVASNVAPGDYYVFASVPGYVQPANQVKAAAAAGADMTRPLPGVPIVHVSADRTANSDLSVQRGAALSGKILFDDGSPVTRATVQIVPVAGKEKPLPPQFGMLALAGGLGGGGIITVTDDLGQFRLAGLAPGEYLVQATLQTGNQFTMQAGVMNMSGLMSERPLIVFGPGTVHRGDAKPFTLHAGEETRDALITLRLNNVHTVSGRITSAEDRHGLNSGSVELTDATDKDFKRTAGLDANGNYTVNFVPPGTYDLAVSDAEDTEPSKKKQTGLMRFASDQTLRSYEDGKASVIVADRNVAGENLELAPSKTPHKKPDLNELIQGLSQAPPPPPPPAPPR